MKVEAPIVPLRGHTWADNDVDLFFPPYFPSSFDAHYPSERDWKTRKVSDTFILEGRGEIYSTGSPIYL